MKPALFLFDIDGTLLHAKGSGRRAFDRALYEVFQVQGALENVSFAGATDLAVLDSVFHAHEIEFNTQNQLRFLEKYAEFLQEELSKKPPQPISGVHLFLESLKSRFPESHLGVVTGNFRTTATLKLSHAKLDHFFSDGGFGDDHRERVEIAKMAAVRFHHKLKVQCLPFLFGDTQSDMIAALANGFIPIGLATGFSTKSDLKHWGAQKIIEHYELGDLLSWIQERLV